MLHVLPVKKGSSARAQWVVCRAPGRIAHRGLLRTGRSVQTCILGRSGISVRKHEGDGATPAGTLRVLGGYRNPSFRTFRGMHMLAAASVKIGWCDSPSHPCYNRPVALPFRASHETLLRTDRLYDVCLILDWNYSRRARNRGSAIFMHMTRQDGGPTQGCIALEPQQMRKLLPALLSGNIAIKVLA